MIIDENSSWGVNRVVGAVVYRNVDGKINMWLEELLVDSLVYGLTLILVMKFKVVMIYNLDSKLNVEFVLGMAEVLVKISNMDLM